MCGVVLSCFVRSICWCVGGEGEPQKVVQEFLSLVMGLVHLFLREAPTASLSV